MRYKRDHKRKSREKILEAADKRIKKQGVRNSSIDEIMLDAGLTRGTFYAHFKSKEHLLIEVILSNTGLLKMLRDRQGESEEELVNQTIDVFRKYLDSANRKTVGTTCTLATMPLESARGNSKIRKAYTERFNLVYDELLAGRKTDEKSRHQLLRILVLAIGGVTLSRATDGSKIADEIEKVCLSEIESLLQKIRTR